eukprot:31087-Hanusia_phi.AAC.2
MMRHDRGASSSVENCGACLQLTGGVGVANQTPLVQVIEVVPTKARGPLTCTVLETNMEEAARYAHKRSLYRT